MGCGWPTKGKAMGTSDPRDGHRHHWNGPWLTTAASFLDPLDRTTASLRPGNTLYSACKVLGRVVHVDAQLQRVRLLRCSTDGRAAGHGPAAPPDQLARSASLVLLI